MTIKLFKSEFIIVRSKNVWVISNKMYGKSESYGMGVCDDGKL